MSWKTDTEWKQITRCTYFLIAEQFQNILFNYKDTSSLVLASSLLTEQRHIPTTQLNSNQTVSPLTSKSASFPSLNPAIHNMQ